MKEIKVKLTFTEPVLGTCPGDPDIYRSFVASNSPDAATMEDEIAAIGVDGVVEKGKTIFPKLDDGTPFFYDYQIKGFFKDSCGSLRKVKGTHSSKIKAYKKEIDGLIFVSPRHIEIQYTGEMTTCQRPLRAATPMGERIALANSEEIPAGAVLEFEVTCLVDEHVELVKEWLEYGQLRGLGQWRNSGKGRFTCKVEEA